MKYLVIGSGGREHAIAWRLLDDGSAKEVYVAPGNGGIDDAFRVDIGADDFEGLASFCGKKKIDMVVVGPEAPLVKGIVDFFESKKIPVFGPGARAAMLEGSKLFAKSIMEKYGVPTAGHRDFIGKKALIDYVNGAVRYPMVIKLDGLAAGKGVGIPENRDQALEFINSAGVKDDTGIFVEEYLDGEEASVLGVSDGTNILALTAAQDHKRVFDDDRGPNTGGTGRLCACAGDDRKERLKRVHDTILQPTIDGMRKEGIPFKGILYAGLMVAGDDIKVLEYNVRFGDPETQVILPLLEGRLGDLFTGAVNGGLGRMSVSFKKKHAITVVMASAGYPGDYEKGKEITGLDRAGSDVMIFHAGTKKRGTPATQTVAACST